MPTRRTFIKTAAATLTFPTIIRATALGQYSPSKRINVGAIGCGRISRVHDLPGIWQFPNARIIAVCDLDANRVTEAQRLINTQYKSTNAVTGYSNYHDLLANKDIDAVVVSTPDHQHALIAAAAVQAGKDVYLQKPASLTIAEGRTLSNIVQASGRILQIGSQQRSWVQFRRAAELVRNGRIGDLKHVEIGLPGDPSGPDAAPMPVPADFLYDAWLGSTPEVFYTEIRVHPQGKPGTPSFDRPGWLRCEQFGAGMITGWGAHHVDSAHWAMNTEYTGPIEVWGSAEFPTHGLWSVHGKFFTHALYANGVTMDISGDFPNGIKFYGSKGTLFVTRTEQTSPTDSSGRPVGATGIKLTGLEASDPTILQSVIGPDEVHLYKSADQHGNWLDSILTRHTPISPVEMGHRACSTCLIHHIAMRSNRPLHWDPVHEHFLNDEEANTHLSRPQRPLYRFS